MLNRSNFPVTGNHLLERDAMAWPPAPWERSATAWRPEVPTLDRVPGFETWPTTPPSAPSRQSAAGGVSLVREIVETLVLTALIFFGIRLVVQNYKIEGSSMEPNLHSGQYLLVNRIAYNLLGKPQRGDIVVFHEWDSHSGKDFIKRVVGVPGDQVEVRQPYVFINGQQLAEPYLNQDTTGNWGPTVLAPDQYFVLGDNRGNSSDSRANGPLSVDHIVGKAWLTYWPLDQVRVISDPFKSYASKR